MRASDQVDRPKYNQFSESHPKARHLYIRRRMRKAYCGHMQGCLSLSTDGNKCAMVNFFFGGGGMNKKLLKHVFHYLVYIVFLSFSQKNVLARYARSIAFYSPHLYIFFSFFGVIIPDCQLPKFTKKAHKIAQNCV